MDNNRERKEKVIRNSGNTVPVSRKYYHSHKGRIVKHVAEWRKRHRDTVMSMSDEDYIQMLKRDRML